MRDQERQLVHRVASQDRSACDEFVQMWDDRIRYWVSRRSRAEKVEEYTQEVWGHLIERNWLRLLQWDGLFNDEAWHENSLVAFLKKLTNNKVTDLLRAEPPIPPRGLDPDKIIDGTTGYGWHPSLEAERSILISVYEDCSGRFKDRDKQLIRLWWEGHTGQEIAEQLIMKANNVYQRRSYLLKQLRDCLVDNLPEYFRSV